MSALLARTRRLGLRRPTIEDLAAYVSLHTDPRTYTHAPETMPTPARCRVRLDGDLDHWAEHGFGNLAVQDRTSGEVVGWAGPTLRPDGSLNLYYRLAQHRIGQGLGRELLDAVVEVALDAAPTRRAVAEILPGNPASVATARACGLQETGTSPDPRGGPTYLTFEAPRITVIGTLEEARRTAVIDLWTRVNDAGGAVGFQAGASRDDVEAALRVQEESIGTGRAIGGLLHAADGGLLGLGFWERGSWWGAAHVLTLRRLMVDPVRRRAGVGRRLMAGLHGLARTVADVELWALSYRSGLGVGDFYAGLGWTETGRQPHGIRLSAVDHRDSVLMMRRPDGEPLRVDGRR